MVNETDKHFKEGTPIGPIPSTGSTDSRTDESEFETISAAESLLRSLGQHGVQYVFANFGTDHTPIIEAAARIRGKESNGTPPEFVICAHEYVALSAAHGYAVTTGKPQAVLVHVDVGTQNLGGAIHNAHRANAPVLIIAGLAPSSDAGYVGSRSHIVHYIQDVFDQTGIVRQYCRWTGEYKPPASPEKLIRRGLERALTPPEGPTYLAATREALEAAVPIENAPSPVRRVRPTGVDQSTLEELTELIDASSNPVLITSKPLGPPGTHDFEPLVKFAETAGVGVIEHSPTALCFPRNHDLHLGFDPAVVFDTTDLVVITRTDVPWVPAKTGPPADTTIVQIAIDPTKETYPHWPFEVDYTAAADPYRTIESLSETIAAELAADRKHEWEKQQQKRRNATKTVIDTHIDEQRLTAETLSATLAEFVDESTIIVEDGVTSQSAILEHLRQTEPGSYFWKGGSSIGWSVGAGLGIKLGNPEKRVISLIGDGSYLLSNPASAAVLAMREKLPILVVIFNNGGWDAVKMAVKDQHPTGASSIEGVPERKYSEAVELSKIADVVDAHTDSVSEVANLESKLSDAVDAVDAGTYSVIDVEIEGK